MEHIQAQHSASSIVQSDIKDVPIWVRTAHSIAFSDIPVVSGGRMPDFCIIGSAKAGTTSLDKYLSDHPGIFMCRQKEPHYFSTDVMLAQGEDWYKGLYADARPDQICGEASTSYTRYPLVAGTAQRMHAANPQMKLVYILRNPVDRVQSEVLQTMKYLKGVTGEDISYLSVDDALDQLQEPTSPYFMDILETSKYDIQLAEFERFFDPSQILLLCQRDLREDVHGLVSRVCDFLGVPSDISFDSATKKNVTADFLEAVQRETVTNRLRAVPGYDLARKLLPKGIKDQIINTLQNDADIQPKVLSVARRQALEADLAPHAIPLQDRVGRPWRAW